MRIAALLLVAFACSTLRAGERNTALAAVDLEVSASVSPESAAAGGLLIHSIVVTNSGPGSALDALMVELPPEDTTYEYLEGPGVSDGWRCTTPAVGARGKISCVNKSFAAGATATFAIGLRIDWCLGVAPLTSAATVSSASSETDPVDNAATVVSAVDDSGACDDGDDCTVSDHCAPGVGFEENFDLIVPPALPPGWTTTLVIGPFAAPAWRPNTAFVDTEPYAVFSSAAPEVRDAVLDSPELRILSPIAQLTFQNRYDLEQSFDGGVLEIKIGDGLFVDILEAGGQFVSGGYDGTISEFQGSPIHGRLAWTGFSGGFRRTVVNLPASVARQTIVLRWRLVSDVTLGRVGQWIDTVTVTGRDECFAGTPMNCDDADACTLDSCDLIAGCTHVTIHCDDGNACTDDTCDVTLQCVHANTTADCDDLDLCTQTDRCASGACVGSNVLVCRDADDCTADSCDPAVGCVAKTANLAASGFSVGRIDGRDLAVLAAAWNSCPTEARYAAAANLEVQDPCIGASDFHLFMEAFGHDCGIALAPGGVGP